MKQYLRQFQWYRWLRILFLAATGIIFIINPDQSFDIILYFISAYLVGLALIALHDGWLLTQSKSDNTGPYTTAVISLILAFLIFPIAHVLLPLLPILLGVVLIINGVNQFFNARHNRQYINVTPWLDYLYSLLLTLLGIVLIFNPWDVLHFFIRLLGIGLIGLAVLEFVNTRLYK
ncbi:hypothetical protein JG30_14580 [Bombilactobacillus mellifer]|uniref:Acid-resistance membrane protein n=1 Tax=Bombilactobacillus mellifer TaxID=1218492 RepID=A0A0F4LR16_9LACO|nr:DUF308 domain-containing protein [Bombilactobacillus mellifer]MBH9991848.1 DUF308 domain-containing protein [Lactobacillus sp. W8092]KJY60768.1 hypothetical protein JG30_14580 [Bombilactobacillus mellifer]MCT6826462.1 DUF308 domain-containing protein [Bombilactobacillus mellifer]MCT6844109.1 DUF308 domain-containing protein [Bombilactobacillus mellifer]MCT6894071.1 DUF308 domain-containing protein [Bombilactobacillus mellifer]